MKILMYAPIFPPMIGGPSTQCFNLCKALRERNERPVVVTVGEHFGISSPNGYPVYRYPWSYTYTPLDRLIRWAIFPFYFVRIVLRERPDIVHCHSVSALSFMAGWVARRRKIPSVIKFAGDWVWETLSTNRVRAKDFEEMYDSSLRARFMRSCERWGLRLFDMIWVPSQFRRSNVVELLGPSAPIRIIPNSLLLPAGGVRDMREGEAATVVSANRFIPHKRVSLIVRVFARIAKPSDKLILIGTGEEREIELVRKEIISSGRAESIILTGKLSSEEVYEQFSKAAVYVSASLEEGFPNVFIEAMHFGLPILSTDVGGCKEMITDGVNGFLVNPLDEEMFAKKLALLMHDRELRNTLARNAFKVSKHYDLKVVIDQFMDMYRALLTHV